MNNDKEFLIERILNTGKVILSILFRTFITIVVLGLVLLFNCLFWSLTFWLVAYKHFIAMFFVGALTICFTIASIVGIITFIAWLFIDKSKGGLSK